MKNADDGFAELLKDVPVPVRASLEQLREIISAQTDFIAYLLLEDQMKGRVSRKQIHQSIQAWAERNAPAPGDGVYAQLGRELAASFDAQHWQLQDQLSRHVDELRPRSDENE